VRFSRLGPGPDVDSLGVRSRHSYSRLAIADGLAMFAALTLVIAVIGAVDAPGDSLRMALVALVPGAVGLSGRSRYVRRQRPPAGRVIAGLASTWAALVLLGTTVYVVTGASPTLADALFESAAGYSTVATTSMDPSTLSLPIGLFRASTQWLGGAVGLLAGVIAFPSIMRGRVQIPKGTGRRIDRLAPTTIVGRRRVLGLYSSLTVVCGIAYFATGMSARGSIVHAMTTLSTGGFSDNADSFLTEGAASRAVATVFMLVAGTSYFALWWLVRGNHRRFVRSPELRLYLAIVASVSVLLVWQVPDLSVEDALFTAASASSTTGLAVAEWTLFPSGALSILLVAVATGAMGASAGSGLRVVRARLLLSHAGHELRRQLDPQAVVAVHHGGRSVGGDELDQLTGYQIAHFGLVGIGAFAMAGTGLGLTESLWTSVSTLSTFGTGPGLGAFGDPTHLDAFHRLLLIPGMLAGRLSILPLLLAFASVMRIRHLAGRQVRRVFRRRR